MVGADPGFQGVRLLTYPRGHLQQDSVDLALLLVVEAHQLVVEINRIERFKEQGLPG